ncbi:helix-turn-helix domain-containing protein [Lactococcus raffinolactis]
MRSYNSKTERFVRSIFSERLRELRKEKGLTQKELANKVNIYLNL